MKVLKIITGLGMGGAEQQICSLADSLTKLGHQVTIVSITGKSVVLPLSTKVSIIECNIKKNPLSLVFAVFRLAKLLFSVKPDVIHSHMFHANIISRVACLITLRTNKLICTAHSINEGGRIRMLSYRLTDFMCSFTTNVSQRALSNFINLRAFNKKKSRTIYNGIDFAKFEFSEENRINVRTEFMIDDNDKLILCVGRLVPEKDYHNILNAIRTLNDENIKVLIIGEGSMRDELQDKIIHFGLKDRVRLIGMRSDVHRFYSAADLFVSSSKWEGFGLVAAEAMGALCPVVATDSGGVAEVVGSQRYLVPIEDSMSLASKIHEMLSVSEPEKAAIVNANYKHVINNFSLNSIVQQWVELYKERALK